MQTLQRNFDHVLSFSGLCGTFEHAEYSRVRVVHGYCADDVARLQDPKVALEDLLGGALGL